MERNAARTALETLIVVFVILGLVLIWIGASQTTGYGDDLPSPNTAMILTGAGFIAWALLTLVITLAAAMVGRMIVGPPPKHAGRPVTDGTLAEK